ncbi:MAG: hypothetical protein A2091_11755 [Desulfuromonadales bacterium GWD2_61_12]|nr:MAG: hypothetical protein A2005_03775 [Desulfuromonadales bacterium GWC2_61_20]OGR34111.1 MAG: hypothetical protein A2091_11755 [Desulfuromonadales bacterium GWD2_61_12]HAD04783.1 hypothetical protein [Desulfuromonas sp.]HBT82303.1 hypothetical protein [Desulfuromonas sp.]
MTLRLREVPLELEADESGLATVVASELGVAFGAVHNLHIVRVAVDARRKSRLLKVYTIEFDLEDEPGTLARNRSNPRLEAVPPVSLPDFFAIPGRSRALVVGMGPAGLFAALGLARSGVDVTLVEQGRAVETRVRDVERFWSGGGLDPGSNVQFGEGGAGTFSDGKLTTRINHPWTRLVLQTLVDCGAPEAILTEAKPHIGTDRLRLVLIRFRQLLQRLGVDIRFETRLTALACDGRQLRAGRFGSDEIACDNLILAPGHSARDTYAMLHAAGVHLEAKAFAMGVRVEHPVELINSIQYGLPHHPRLPNAEYSLTWNDPVSGRGIYSFCMCPGGEVVIASSEPGGVVVNGMSRLRRDRPFSNSALVVAVRPDDFSGSGPLSGVAFQRSWEEAAFRSGGGDYRAPAQNLLSFLGRGSGPLCSTARPGVHEADLSQVLPPFVTEGIRLALPHFDRRMRGFITGEATLLGVESRTSAPLRIVRGEDGQSISHSGLYPAGEGAGYAGGIISAALDGLRSAEKIVQRLNTSGVR